jgi:hypothetical protein
MKKKLEQSPSELRTAEVDGDALPFLVGLGILEMDEGGILRLSNEIHKINMAICPHCNMFLRSMSRHDLVPCDCGNGMEDGVFIDGGMWYCRFGGKYMDDIILPERPEPSLTTT